MSWYHPSTLLDRVFESGLVLKGISGALEALTGLALFFISPATLQQWVSLITQRERIEDPHDYIAHLLLGWTNDLVHGGQAFIIAYLWLHAAIKLITVIGILRNKLWAYPFALVTLTLFIWYQIYQLGFSPSWGLAALTLFDMGLLWLVWREYGQAKRNLPLKISAHS